MRSDRKRRSKSKAYGCAVEAAFDVIGTKWKGAILYHLLDGTKRYNQLRRIIPSVTQRVLTKQLRELEEDKIISRKVYPEVPPKVEYTLTEKGQSLKTVLCALREWGMHFFKLND